MSALFGDGRALEEVRRLALDEKAAALQRAKGVQLTLRSELLKQANPGLALVLAVEGARRNPGLFANNTLLAALNAKGTARADLVAVLMTGIPGGVVPGFPGNFTGNTIADLLRLNMAASSATLSRAGLP